MLRSLPVCQVSLFLYCSLNHWLTPREKCKVTASGVHKEKHPATCVTHSAPDENPNVLKGVFPHGILNKYSTVKMTEKSMYISVTDLFSSHSHMPTQPYQPEITQFQISYGVKNTDA